MKKEIVRTAQELEAELENVEIIPIRTETVLSQYPLHSLNKGCEPKPIQIARDNSRGKATTTWRVSPNPDYGKPGILAYKIDTLVINRIIDQLRPEIPAIVRLGSLSEIGRQLGRNIGREGATRKTDDIAKALSQNAGALITCKIEYTGNDGKNRTLELRSTRYGVIFVGETLPDGRKADAVYVSLNPVFQDVLRHAKTRPLDYEYLIELPPSSQRLYELISYQIFGALKNGNPRAKYSYSDLCKFAPLTRYDDREKMRKQLFKIHQPHIKAGYIKKAEFEEVRDEEGRIDWVIWYTPGRKARHEFKTFTARREKQIASQPSLPQLLKINPEQGREAPAIGEEEKQLTTRLIDVGIASGKAAELAKNHPTAAEREMEALLHRDLSKIKDPAAWLIRAIENGEYSQPKPLKEKKAEKDAASAKQKKERHEEEFRAAYNRHLRAEMRRIEKTSADVFARFESEFDEIRQVVKQLSAGQLVEFRLCSFERFADEHPELGVLTFWQWDQEKNPKGFHHRAAESAN